jgi:hypothetical protein
MKENIGWPPDGYKSAKFNPRVIKPKLDALKINNTSNIQAIKLNFFNNFFQKEFFEIFKQEKFEDEQLIRYFLFQIQIFTVTKSGLLGMTAFHKQHFKKLWIIWIYTSNPTKGIM